jgi:hypothetical protein
MKKTIQFFSDYLNKDLDVEIYIEATSDESWVKSIDMYDETGEFISKASLSPDELRQLNELADEIAQENRDNAYLGHREYVADFQYDSEKENRLYDNVSELMSSSDGYMVEDENG